MLYILPNAKTIFTAKVGLKWEADVSWFVIEGDFNITITVI